jgi:hypothetical protein
VTRDGEPVSQASWGVPLPVDVGSHTIEATAPGRKPFKTSVLIQKDGDKKELAIAKLEVDDSVATTPPTSTVVPPPPHPVEHDDDGATQRTVGYIVAGVGVAGLVVGGVTGFLAIGKENDSKKACPNSGACADQSGVDANSSAKTLGTVSTIAFIAGGVALAGGAALILTSRSGSRKGELKVFPSVGPQTAGLGVLGTF